jgi:predicted aldo/keto reductase-like oxidoreductase
MKMVELGKTGLTVSEMCVGTLTLGKLQANVSAEEGAAAIRRAIDLGANFIDTAQAYGSYEHVAHAIRGVEKDLVISSKSHAGNYEEMEKAIYECRKALHREVIDIFHLHLIRDEEDLNGRGWALKCILDFKEAGAVRALGATVHSNAGLQAVADCPDIEVAIVCVNERGLGIADGSLEECLELARLCRERGKAIIAMKPLGGGHLLDHAAEAINFVRDLEEIDAVAVGLLTPEEAEMDVRIFNDEDIPADLANAVGKEPKHLVIYDSCTRCGNCVERCPQDALTQKESSKTEVDDSKCVLCGYCADVCPNFAIRVI